MDIRTNHVYQGIWRDYSRPLWNGYQWTLTEKTALAMTNLIAVTLALALSRLPMLMKPLVAWCRQRRGKRRPINPDHAISDGITLGAVGASAPDGQTTPIPMVHIDDGHAWHDESNFSFNSIGGGLASVANTIFRGRIEVGMTDTGLRRLGRQIANNARQDTLRFSLALLFAFCLVGLFVMEQTLAILSANIISSSQVLSTHPDCGAWRLNYTAYDANGSHKAPADWLHMRRLLSKELRAQNYAEQCYGVGDKVENCNTFSTRMIKYTITRQAACPFSDGMCSEGPFSALSMDTGHQPLSVLGLNAPIHSTFRRKTVCSPLETGKYIAMGFHNISDLRSFYWMYRYGWPIDQAYRRKEPILYSHIDDSVSGTFGYQLNVKGSNIGIHDLDSFDPIQELRVPFGGITIFFLHSNGILYDKPRQDPIFPANANRTLHLGNTSSLFFFYDTLIGSAHATVLGCVDHHEMCLTSTDCAYYDDQATDSVNTTHLPDWGPLLRENIFGPAALAFSYHSFERSGTSWAYKYSRERGLDAWGKTLMDRFQFGLDQNQWEIEAQKVFNVSLAQMQMNAWDIARGEKFGPDIPQFDVFETDRYKTAEIKQRLCSRITIEGYGWKNVSLFWFVALLLLSTSMAIGSIEIDETLVSVRIWNFTHRVSSWIFTSVLLTGCQRVRQIRWRDCLARMLKGFGWAATKLSDAAVKVRKRRARPNGPVSLCDDAGD